MGMNNEQKSIIKKNMYTLTYHTLQPAIWTTDVIGNSDHIYVTRNDR